jgi:hypothetical protein
MANITRTTSEKQANNAKPVPEAMKCFEEIPAAGSCMICHLSRVDVSRCLHKRTAQSRLLGNPNQYVSSYRGQIMELRLEQRFFFKFSNLFAICIHTLNTISKLCVEKRGRVEECLKGENLVWLSGKKGKN